MNDFHDPHTPAPEFRAALKQELKRAYRAEEQFGAERTARARNIGLAIGLAAGTVFTLTLGLVLGAATTNASAEGLGDRSRESTPTGLAKIGTPVRNAITALTCSAAPAKAAVVQQGIPVVSVTTTAKSTTKVGAVLGLHELSDGHLLVNDAGRRQVTVFDPSLTTAAVGLDSSVGSANSYGPRPAGVMAYRGDSLLFVDAPSKTFLVLDRNGHVAHAVALPTYEVGDPPYPRDFPRPIAADVRGRLIAKGGTAFHNGVTADSSLILRADLDLRSVEVVGAVRQRSSTTRQGASQNGKRILTTFMQAAPIIDSWSVLSDGTVAFVRGQDYHVDWLFPDGTKGGTTKLSFDWKRLTDEDKQKLIDSARVVWDSLTAITNARNAGAGRGAGGDPDDVGTGGAPVRGRSGGGAVAPGQDVSVRRIEFVPPAQMPDFYPPVSENSAMADRDGNLWILPTTSAQSQHGELVYDVVHPKRGLFERVRMPVGRSIAGFGKGGVLYLQAGDRANGFTIERVKVDHVPSSK